ncbi:hypothetical protein HL653_19425 [Sphingomonas sp. AP4-R1]|uniref:NTF2 fold immunity protein n=1 Tax=Sphingomonas sp. AP4-R1 TaxID=2735134 RepID=UPI001493B1AF|nr:NTF2 fold immunity protein [Sphingomonas sp. AP4-R1]QJU59633.1 hypothetical protein HL653_19425 [Sphingomonas sp. AP4-R1]
MAFMLAASPQGGVANPVHVTTQSAADKCREDVEIFQPKGGIVDNEKIAIDIADRYLRRALPGMFVRPLSAKLRNGIWIVHGFQPERGVGGTAYIEMCRSNGKVLKIYGTQ